MHGTLPDIFPIYNNNNDNDNNNNNNNDNDIFIILTGIYIAKLHSIISLKLLLSPDGLISQYKTSSVHNLCVCEEHA